MPTLSCCFIRRDQPSHVPCDEEWTIHDRVAELAEDLRSRLVGVELSLARIELAVSSNRTNIDELKRRVKSRSPPVGLIPGLEAPVLLPAIIPLIPRIAPSRARMRRLLPVAEEEDVKNPAPEGLREGEESGEFSLVDSSEDGSEPGRRSQDDARARKSLDEVLANKAERDVPIRTLADVAAGVEESMTHPQGGGRLWGSEEK